MPKQEVEYKDLFFTTAYLLSRLASHERARVKRENEEYACSELQQAEIHLKFLRRGAGLKRDELRERGFL
jgi:hypothetical protein